MFIPGCEIQLWEKRYVGCDPEADWCGLCIPSRVSLVPTLAFLLSASDAPAQYTGPAGAGLSASTGLQNPGPSALAAGPDRERTTSPPSISFLELTLLPGPTPSFEILAIHLLGPQSVQKITWKWPSGQESADLCTGPRWHNCASSGRHPAEVACSSQARPPVEAPWQCGFPFLLLPNVGPAQVLTVTSEQGL